MTDIVIIIVLVVLMLLGLRATVKHFKGEGGCCGGGSTVKAKRKRLKQVAEKRTMRIEGMSCEHCKNRVERSLNALDGVAARVNLRKKMATILLEKDVSNELLEQTVEQAGYQGKVL